MAREVAWPTNNRRRCLQDRLRLSRAQVVQQAALRATTILHQSRRNSKLLVHDPMLLSAKAQQQQQVVETALVARRRRTNRVWKSSSRHPPLPVLSSRLRPRRPNPVRCCIVLQLSHRQWHLLIARNYSRLVAATASAGSSGDAAGNATPSVSPPGTATAAATESSDEGSSASEERGDGTAASTASGTGMVPSPWSSVSAWCSRLMNSLSSVGVCVCVCDDGR